STEIIQGIVNFFRGGFDLVKQSENFVTAIAANYGRLGKEQARIVAEDIKEFTLQLAADTPFTTSELFDAAQIIAVSEDADKVKNALVNTATVAAAAGTDLQGVALIYQQTISKGFLDTGDLNQLAGRGVAFQNTLAEVTGRT